ncbi:choice-of-anchor G family protein, partial [Clavibacter sp. MX14-G9D]|uniref:choice-of-anchor G family protein n=1 Tax=Clavibacter sp. MX14-G9D TaxID=3064656 RepID=UPI00293E1273
LAGRAPSLVAAGVAVALVAGAVTPGIVPVAAAWTDREWAKGAIGTEDLDCGTSTGFTTTASARFLRGSLLSLPLDTVAGVSGLSAVDDAAPGSRRTPATAPSLGSGAYANPLAITAVSGAAALDLTGLSAGLPAGSAGALNQYVRVTETGTSTAASGLVSDSGGVGVTSGTSASLPGRATISLARVLPATTDIARAELAVGAVASRATLDWCSARRSALWGDGSVDGVIREYGIAGLELRVASPVVGGVATAVGNTTTTVLPAAVAALSGTTGTIATSVGSALDALIGGLVTTGLTGSVTLTGVEAATAAVTPLLTKPLRSPDGSVAIDLATGTVLVDLAALTGRGPGGLNGLPPNTELVLSAPVVNAISARVGVLMDTRTAEIQTALTTALQAVKVSIALTTEVRTSNTLLGIRVLKVGVGYEGTLGDLASGARQLAVTADALGLGATLNPILAGLGLGNIDLLSALVRGLGSSLVSTLTTTLGSLLVTPVTTLGATLSTLSGRLVTAVAAVVNPLPSVLSVMVNVQPDRPGAPPGSVVVPGIGRDTSPERSVTALRIGLLDSAAPALGLSAVELATSTAGRNAYRAP